MLVFRPKDEKENAAAYEAQLDNVKCGRCEFTYRDLQMYVTHIDSSDDIITEGLLRSAMNYCAGRGVYTCTIEPGMLSPAARRLGFSQEDFTVDIPEALTSTCCRHGGNN
jgi:hypothetical protein